jgi:hypothetical protein
VTDLHADTDTIARQLGDRLEEVLDVLAPGWVSRRGAAYPRPNAARGALGSFRVELVGAKRGQWYRHSQDVGGGVLKLFAYLHSGEKSTSLDRDTFEAARAFLGLPSPFSAGRTVDGAEVARRRAEAEERAKARAAEHAKAAADYRLKQGLRAKDLWAASVAAAGTPVAAWLEARGLPGVVIPPTIRFHPKAPFRVVDVVEGKRVTRILHAGPAMVAVVTDGGAPHGGFRGVHVTWLSADGRAKAEIVDGKTGDTFPARRMIGPAQGGHVRLAPAAAALAVAEGIETALSVQHYTGWSTFAALSLGNLGAKLPATVAEVTLCFDSDERQPKKAERLKAAAAREHAARGLAVRVCAAPAGMDFNDVAMRMVARGAAVGRGQPAVGGSL